ncbi:type I restriction endonuclease subunit S [Hafnia alvei]|uniref:restriction endonuclease subunit S n=1 Tax=Hafnia alvei TaxID=569 RepID=UPI000DAAF0B2|nr:restriction endonuclease subunit S [Hafnia alvei]AWV46661.1 type I restriction endonuclease subunit S [Hafnia alvei]
MVPEGWQLSTIEKIATVSSGGTPSRKNLSYWNGNIPWVTTAEVQFKTIFDTAEKITVDGLNNSSAKLFPKNTILMAMYGQGKTRGQVAKLGIEATTNQACAAILLKTGYEIDYYYQFLISQYEHIREMSNNGGQENLSAGIVKSIQVPVPPLFEQKKIAQILSTWDKTIANVEQLLANSQQQKKALMQQLLTGNRRFPGFTGKWVSAQLRDMAKVVKGRALSSKDLIDGEVPVIAGGKSSPYKHGHFTHENVVTVSASGAYAGYVAYHPNKIWASDCSVVVTKEESSIGYLYQLLTLMQEKIYSLQSGGAQPHIYPKDLESLQVIIPPKSEQEKISFVLTICDKEIETLKQKLYYLKQEKKALMQQLLTGKRRVKVDAA